LAVLVAVTSQGDTKSNIFFSNYREGQILPEENKSHFYKRRKQQFRKFLSEKTPGLGFERNIKKVTMVVMLF